MMQIPDAPYIRQTELCGLDLELYEEEENEEISVNYPALCHW